MFFSDPKLPFAIFGLRFWPMGGWRLYAGNHQKRIFLCPLRLKPLVLLCLLLNLKTRGRQALSLLLKRLGRPKY